MSSIQFIVTGKLEETLPEALARFFPTLDFLPAKWFQGFTSVKIDEQIKRKTEHKRDVDKLANALVATAEKKKAADMIIVVDDLEIINLYHPEKVVECFREAVENQMQVHKSTQRVRKKLQNDCSFHLLVPMIEAYFFGDKMDHGNPAALNKAGAILKSTVSGKNLNVEDFKVIEHIHQGVDYLTATGTSNWAKTLENRDKHPKKYLDYLCCPETDKKTARKHRYRETKGGVEALKILDWNTVLSSKQNYVKFLRALIHDIAWKFDLPIDDTGQCASFTEYTDKPNRVLRNI
ncbi:MAG: hypothetical protein KAI83_05790 [Thiomargarita sp.]|nr:hypothetical protein [Thiomargarita sp.]